MSDELLRSALLELRGRLDELAVPVVLAGGYGLYLLQLDRADSARTLIDGDRWPAPRTTEDFDLFIPSDILASLDRMRDLRTVLDALGYRPVEEAKFMQFVKDVGPGRVKVDLLAPPITDEAPPRLKISPPRVRPKGNVNLHAHLTEEAVGIESHVHHLEVDGTRGDGAEVTCTVAVAHPFTYLLMKLHAFADRVGDVRKDQGRHHALDLYRIVAMLTESEYDEAHELAARHRDAKAVQRAAAIVADHFARPESLGALRLREHPSFFGEMALDTFLEVLAELFPST